MANLSWPHITEDNPTAEQRAERVLNLIHGKNMWTAFAHHAIAVEIAAAELVVRMALTPSPDR